jgi:hypothetical protein
MSSVKNLSLIVHVYLLYTVVLLVAYLSKNKTNLLSHGILIGTF